MDEHRPKKLLDQVHACPEFIQSLRRTSRRDAIRLKRYSYRAEQANVGWSRRPSFGIKRYIH